MKKYDMIKVVNVEDYSEYNLYPGAKGVVIKDNGETVDALLFNDYNEGDHAFLEINKIYIRPICVDMPQVLRECIRNNLNGIKHNKKGFKPRLIRAKQSVLLLTERTEYAERGIHEGAVGIIMEQIAVKDYVIVDFRQKDLNNNIYGDCIPVKLEDLMTLD